MSVLKIKDQNGQWTDVLSIKGEKGDNGQDYVLTENDKQEIAQDVAELVDIPVDDVQINGTSVVSDRVAGIPIIGTEINSTGNSVGLIPIHDGYANGFQIMGTNSKWLSLKSASETGIKNGRTQNGNGYGVIDPTNISSATFYGLAKSAGDTTQSASDNAVGTYTDDAKASIQSMLGVPSEDEVVTDVQIDSTSIIADGVAEIPIASTSNFGVTKIKSGYGIRVSSSNEIIIDYASEAGIKNGVQYYTPIVPRYQHNSVFYGLAKASGDTTQAQSSNAIGTYTDEAKASIQSMLGVPSEDEVITDVQISGTSIVTDGIANIPVARAGGNTIDYMGVVGIGNTNGYYGIRLIGDGILSIEKAPESKIKKGSTESYQPIVPNNQHIATFYGLAKAAGFDEKDSTLPVGQYTESAQTAIKQMLGVKDDYDSLVVEVSGTDPVITGKASYRYNCGELYTLSITPPESGTMDIIFTSGATPTVLTLPNTVKMPTWWAGIETNTTYEMCITDGVYCGVMSWAQ